MEKVVLVIHLMLASAIIALVLLQRSEGGGLGIGGSGGMGGLASPQSTANALTRATSICAFCFFVTSLTLGVLAGTHSKGDSILDQVESGAEQVIEKVEETTDPVEPVVPISE